MLFTEPTFLFLFLPLLLLLIGWQRTHGRASNLILLGASLLFYAKGGGIFTWLMLASMAFNYGMAIAIDRVRGTRLRAAQLLLTFAVGVDLAVLAVFKYTPFAVANLNGVRAVLGWHALTTPAIVLPIGISFYTFHAISYVVDVWRRDATAQKSPVHAALYLLLFPQLIAGPIVRYRDIAPQLARRRVTLDDWAVGVQRFVIGLGKKLLIANTLAGPVDKLFALPASQLSGPYAWLGIVCYTLQIYFDFSGYSDMAIGLARLCGFRFLENFRWPYAADSVQEFWRRWHISLSSWFRDYVYVPLGGNRVSVVRTYGNLVTVFFLCGLWHGASWAFVVWGLYHGMFLVLERLGLGRWLAHRSAVLRHAYLLLAVMVGWVFFRAETLADATQFLAAMAGHGGTELHPLRLGWYLTPDVRLALVAGLVGSFPLAPAFHRWRDRQPGWRLHLADATRAAMLLAVVGLSWMQVAGRAYNPFIYFRF